MMTSHLSREDEKTGKKYNLDSNPQKKRNAEKYVVEEGEKHIASLEIPAGMYSMLLGGCSPKKNQKKPVATPKSANWHWFFLVFLVF